MDNVGCKMDDVAYFHHPFCIFYCRKILKQVRLTDFSKTGASLRRGTTARPDFSGKQS